MIAAIYARKSTDDSDKNEEARSTARQIARATEYATAKGWTVDPRYIFVDDARVRRGVEAPAERGPEGTVEVSSKFCTSLDLSRCRLRSLTGEWSRP